MILMLLLAWNLFVAFWNARLCGLVWTASRVVGGWGRLVIWCAAIQSVIGFSMIVMALEMGVLSFLVPAGAHVWAKLPALFYLTVIVPAIGSGLIIVLHSWIEAFKRKDAASFTSAGLNTLIEAHDISQATSGIADAFGSISSLFDADEDGIYAVVVLFALILAIGLGGLGTYAVIQIYKDRLRTNLLAEV